MAEKQIVTEERVVENPNTQPVTRTATAYNASSYHRVANIIYLVSGLLEALLALRFVFLLLGANSTNGFVSFIYDFSGIFVAPFNGIFGTPIVGRAVFDTATLVALVIYALLAWALGRILATISNRPT